MIKGISACYKGPLPFNDIARISRLAREDEQVCIRAAVDTVDQALAIIHATVFFANIKVMFLVEKTNHNLVVDLANNALENTHAIELLNEPNLVGITASDCGSFTQDAYNILRGAGFRGDILAGCIWNLKLESLKYLANAGVLNWADDIIISYHRYPVKQDAVDLPQLGSTREVEYNTFKITIGNHRTACTEFGWHFNLIKPYWYWPFISRPAIDESSAYYEAKVEFNYHKEFKDEYAIFYQYTDGPKSDNSGLARFGIRDYNSNFRMTEKAIREA